MALLPVHCCCDPRVVLGTLEVPDEYCRPEGAEFRIAMRESFSWPSKEDLEVAAKPWREGDQYLVIEVAPLWLEFSGRAQFILAVKSNDLPIEKFRRLPGFIENQHRRDSFEER